MAARIALRAKCGASDEDGFMKDRNKLTEGPTNAGAKVAGMKTNDFVALKDKITEYMHGERMGFSQPGLDLLKSRESDLSRAMGMPVTQPVTLSSLMGGSGGAAGAAGDACPARGRRTTPGSSSVSCSPCSTRRARRCSRRTTSRASGRGGA